MPSTSLVDEQTQPVMLAMLESFADVFQKPQGLPPTRSQDHAIHLVARIEHVNVKLY